MGGAAAAFHPFLSKDCLPAPVRFLLSLAVQARHEQVDTEAALAALKRSAQQEVVDLDAEDEEAVRWVGPRECFACLRGSLRARLHLMPSSGWLSSG